MLVLARWQGESLRIGNDIIVTVSDIKNGHLKLRITAPKGVINRVTLNNKGLII